MAWGNSPETSPESGALKGGKLASNMQRGSGQQCFDKSLVTMRALLFKSQLFEGALTCSTQRGLLLAVSNRHPVMDTF